MRVFQQMRAAFLNSLPPSSYEVKERAKEGGYHFYETLSIMMFEGFWAFVEEECIKELL